MISFLFWNLNKSSLEDRVAELAEEHQVDVVMLAECETAPRKVVQALTGRTNLPFCYPLSASRKVRVFTRFPESSLRPVFDDPSGRLTIRRLLLSTRSDVLLAVVHFPSKVNWTEDDQLAEASNLVRDIATAEEERGHQRTILVGDLNMNPFDKGLVAANGLHAVMTRQIATRKTRQVGARQYPFFYNPMWGCFGDRTIGPAGTHYYQSSGHISYFWNLFDQVLLRPDLMHLLAELTIVDRVGSVSLLSKRGLPSTSVGSDHLPVLFRVDLPT